MRGSASSARAIEISCRSPAERPAPPSRTSCSRPPESRAATRSTPTAAAAAATSSSVASGFAKRMFDGDRAAEEERILEHDAELAAVRAELHVAQVVRRRRAPRPRPGRSGGRSGARASTSRGPTRRRARSSRPARHVERDAVQHRLLAVGEDEASRGRGRLRSAAAAARPAGPGSRAPRRGCSRSSPSPPRPTGAGRRRPRAPAAAGRRAAGGRSP